MAVYLTFLLDMSNETHLLGATLRFQPDAARMPAGPEIWKVACDEEGRVTVHGEELVLIATATWNGSLVDRIEKREVSDKQWVRLERAIKNAQSLASPGAVDGYRAFLLDARDGSIVEGSVRAEADPALVPDRIFVWKVTLDGARVVVVDRDGDELGTATWAGQLTDTSQRGPIPTRKQWGLVATAIGRARALPGTVDPMATYHAKMEAGHRAGIRLLKTVGAVLVLGVAVMAVASWATRPAPLVARTKPASPTPTPPPTQAAPPRPRAPDVADELDLSAAVQAAGAKPELLAKYRVRWSEVDVASQTTVEQVEKEPADEVGKRICVEGELERITRADLAGRKHYAGSLKTAQGDRVDVVISGSAGTLVKRQQARVCGAVLGASYGVARVYGMLDLPENRNPIVEQP